MGERRIRPPVSRCAVPRRTPGAGTTTNACHVTRGLRRWIEGSLNLRCPDPARYGGLALASDYRKLLRGEVEVRLCEDPKLALPKKARAGRTAAARTAAVDAADATLFDALRDCRQRLAGAHNVPPYVVFRDATLMQMAAEKPTDAHALLDIHGVGRAKLERYGEEFLSIIRASDAGGSAESTASPGAERGPSCRSEAVSVSATGTILAHFTPSLDLPRLDFPEKGCSWLSP